LSQFFSGVNIRVLSALESPFQFFQLFGRESGARATLFALQRNARLRFNIRIVLTRRASFYKEIKVFVVSLENMTFLF
jgi:hypothetical protein